MIERKGIFQFQGKPVSVLGMDLQTGSPAPEFHAVNLSWEEIFALESTRGKVRIIASLPSLDTSVCDIETRRFNQEAASLSSDIAIIMISADLPFSQARWCGAAGVERLLLLSDHKYMDFGQKYACQIIEARILRRAVFIIDRQDVLRYADYMSSLGDQPDYDAVLKAARPLLDGK